MSFEEIVSLVRERFGSVDLSQVGPKLAIQIDLTGDNGGTFYVEVKNGCLAVEPYEYRDRDVKLILSADHFLKMIDGKLDPILAFSTGKLKVEGDIGKALELKRFIGSR